MNLSIMNWITKLFEPQKSKTPKYLSGKEKAESELKDMENGSRTVRKHSRKKKKN